MAIPVILVAASPRDPASGSVVPVHLAGHGGQPYFYAGTHWRAGISALPRSIESLDFDGSQLGGGGVAQALELAWSPAGDAALADIAGLMWIDAPIAVRIGPDSAVPPIVTEGTVLDARADGGVLSLAMADNLADLKRPILEARWGGTGGLDGPAALEGQLKERAWGRCYNVPGRPLDAPNNIWVFGDPSRAWEAFVAVRDRGVVPGGEVTVLAWQGSVEATFAALQAAAVPSGGAILCPSIACVKWWTAPAGDLHADIRGEIAGGYAETPAEIAERLLTARSTLTIAPGTVTAAVAARPVRYGYRVTGEATTAAQAVSEILGDVSTSWRMENGQVVLLPWGWSAPVAALRSHRVTRREVIKPWGTRKLGYRRNQHPMARGDLADIVFASDLLYEDGEPLRSVIEDLRLRLAGVTNRIETIEDAYGEIIGAADDGSLTISEKVRQLIPRVAELEAMWALLDGQAAAIVNSGVSAARANAAGARAQWNSFRNGISPPWNDTTQASPVDRDTYRARLQGYALGLVALDQALRYYAQLNADLALDEFDAIVSNNILDRAEKQRFIAAWEAIASAGGKYQTLVARVNARALSPAALTNAYEALAAYLGSLSPAWNDISVDTPIDRGTFRARWLAYENAAAALDAALDAQAQTQENAALGRINDILSDGILSRNEKPQLIREWEALLDRLNKLVSRHDALGQPADANDERGAAGNAVYQGQSGSLGTYLYDLAPSWFDTNVDTPLPNNGITLADRWRTAYQRVNAFEAALIGTVPQDIRDAIDALDGLADDSMLDAKEKSSVLRPRHNDLENAWNVLQPKAAQLGGSAVVQNALTTATNARSDWHSYILSLSQNGQYPAWDNTSGPTPVDRTTFRARLSAYGAGLEALSEALRAYVDVRATTALDRTTAMDNDGILTCGEKWLYVREWRALVNKYQRAVDRYIALGYPSSVQLIQQNAYNIVGPDGNAPASSLGKTLGTLTPQWDNSNFDTPIPNPQALQDLWVAADNATDALISAMLAQPNADNTSAAINAGQANAAIDNRVGASPKLSQLDNAGQATSRRLNTMYALGGAQQVYVPQNGNTNVGGSVVAGVPGSPIWAYTDPTGGGTATVQIFEHTLTDDAGSKYYNGGFFFNMMQGRQYWVFEDGGFNGGSSPGYQITDNAAVLNSPNRRLIGGVFTPTTQQVGAGGGTSGGGGGGGGIRERYYNNQRTSSPNPQQ